MWVYEKIPWQAQNKHMDLLGVFRHALQMFMLLYLGEF